MQCRSDEFFVRRPLRQMQLFLIAPFIGKPLQYKSCTFWKMPENETPETLRNKCTNQACFAQCAFKIPNCVWVNMSLVAYVLINKCTSYSNKIQEQAFKSLLHFRCSDYAFRRRLPDRCELLCQTRRGTVCSSPDQGDGWRQRHLLRQWLSHCHLVAGYIRWWPLHRRSRCLWYSNILAYLCLAFCFPGWFYVGEPPKSEHLYWINILRKIFQRRVDFKLLYIFSEMFFK